MFSATFYYLLLEEAEKYISAFDKHSILFPRLYSFHISQGRKVLACDLWSRTVRRLWWLIVLLWDFAVVLTYGAPTVKHLNALCLSRDKQLNLLSHQKVINSLSWMESFRDLSVIPSSIILRGGSGPNCKISFYNFISGEHLKHHRWELEGIRKSIL